MLPSKAAISDNLTPKWLKTSIWATLAIVAILQIIMALRFEINWDEFFLLEWVYKWNAGELDLVLQTIYFRFFSWLPFVSDNEASQIMAARGIMLACLGVTSWLIYNLCRKFTTSTNAVLSLLFFLTMSFVFRNATSFRADALVTMTLMGILSCLMTPILTWKRVWICGILLGLAGMITIKAIFYVPIISVILLAHWGHSKWQFSIFLKSISLGALALLSFGILYALHSLSIKTTASSADYLAHSTNGSLFEAGLFPRFDTLLDAIKSNIILSILMIVGVLYCLSKTITSNMKWAYIAALTFIFPLSTIIFYRHAFPYFYSFMLAPATILIAIGLSMPVFKRSYIFTFAFLIAIFVSTFSVFIRSLPQNLDTQKQVLTTVHKLFPKSTAYIDRCAMVASYPKSGLFMSGWMMTNYYKENTPIMENILTEEQPKFILANIDSLNLDNITENTKRRFLTPDETLLKQNYIHHWGPIYVAGKTMDIAANTPKSFKAYIAGPYGVESQHPVQVNGKTYQPGDIVQLDQGEHFLSSVNAQSITFRWNNTAVPNIAATKKKLFHGF